MRSMFVTFTYCPTESPLHLSFLILEVAGAYGAAMSSNYNSKFLAPEVLIENGEPRLIRRKQTFEHLIANEIF